MGASGLLRSTQRGVDSKRIHAIFLTLTLHHFNFKLISSTLNSSYHHQMLEMPIIESHDFEESESSTTSQRGGRGLPFSKLGVQSLWMKALPKSFHSPRQIAKQIRRIRGHSKSSVHERHRNFDMMGRALSDTSCPNYDDLFPHCMNLIALGLRGSETEERKVVEEQVLKLCVEDPCIYLIFQECKREIQSKTSPSQVAGFEMLDTEDFQTIYLSWSKLIADYSFRSNGYDLDPEIMQSRCEVLKDTLRIETNPYIAVEYLPHAMALKLQDEDLELLRQLWDHFLDCVAESGNLNLQVWIKNIDLCFKNIILSRKPLEDFASPAQLARIAVHLVEHPHEVPFTLNTFFAPPELNFRGSKHSIYDVTFAYPPVGQWDLAKVSSYATFFMRSVERNKFNDDYDLSSYVLNLRTNNLLQKTVFGPRTRTWVQLYEVLNDALSSCRDARGVVDFETFQDSSVYRNLLELVSSALGAIWSGIEGNTRFIARQHFFLSQSVDLDRYYKREMILQFQDNTRYIKILNDRERFLNQLRIPNGIRHITVIPQFRNVPYLRRYRIEGKYYITQEGFPERLLQTLNPWNRHKVFQSVSVDTMFLNASILTYLQIHGGKMPFDCKGHYPILAGYEEGSDEPLYVAFIRQKPDLPWYFTTVKNGASSATYTNELGEEHVATEFFVLVLRHDPTDLPSSILPHSTGVKDPTGPVHWVEFWPKTEHYRFHNATLKDDRLLLAFIEEIRLRRDEENRVISVLDF
ncbi:hypothetical protein SCHPADRAFT_1000735 [Schizopora paradoxa]|uniref:Uncharacterized protein n=1 Tax=Schizopora paradoxa TaxID=27342 RepID=A0A0H2RGT4_9AGAM|nr:hypothetical protein SCHPADRAFT_1000735 [Schizopora paradoxa]